jgi:hypothetical protein
MAVSAWWIPGVALQRNRMQRDAVQNREQPAQPLLGRLQHHAPDESMNLIPFSQEQFGQIGSILARNTGD